jgi:hypothetical protein
VLTLVVKEQRAAWFLGDVGMAQQPPTRACSPFVGCIKNRSYTLSSFLFDLDRYSSHFWSLLPLAADVLIGLGLGFCCLGYGCFMGASCLLLLLIVFVGRFAWIYQTTSFAYPTHTGALESVCCCSWWGTGCVLYHLFFIFSNVFVLLICGVCVRCGWTM